LIDEVINITARARVKIRRHYPRRSRTGAVEGDDDLEMMIFEE
jgi:hypothetical protein